MNIDDLFDFTSFTVDRDPHIVVDTAKCIGCDSRSCVTCCPARCYQWSDSDSLLTFVHDGCLECGTCHVVCHRNAFTLWRYPRGGFGVAYRST